MEFFTNLLSDPEGWGVLILAVLGLGSAIARFTPNDSDNKAMAMIWDMVNKLGLRGGSTD